MRSDCPNDCCATSPDASAENVPIIPIRRRKYLVDERLVLTRHENILVSSIQEYNIRHAIGKWTIIG